MVNNIQKLNLQMRVKGDYFGHKLNVNAIKLDYRNALLIFIEKWNIEKYLLLIQNMRN